MPPQTSPEVIEKLKHAPDVDGVHELIRQRWSPRAFSDKEIPAAELKTLFEAARWAASSSNEQPWRFLVGRRGDETYQKIFNALVPFNQTWAKSAPVLVLSVAKKTFTEKGTPNRHALHDTGAATANLFLQATAVGLHTHSMAGFDAEQLRASFAIPLITRSARLWPLVILATLAACPSICTRSKYLRGNGSRWKNLCSPTGRSRRVSNAP